MNDTFVKYIADREHYTEVLERISKVKHHLWIGTANIKDLHMRKGYSSTPFLAIIDSLIKKGVEVRLIYAKEPGSAFRENFDKYPRLAESLERILYPRVHFKLMIFDLEMVYIGSANLTGAGIGMKSELRRNFETGILTNDPNIVEAVINPFDGVWMGSHYKKCGRKEYCGDRIV